MTRLKKSGIKVLQVWHLSVDALRCSWGYSNSMPATTLCNELLHLFRRLTEIGNKSTPQNVITVIEAWTQALSTDDFLVYRTLPLIQMAIARTEKQISQSGLDADAKALATSILGGWRTFVQPGSLNVQFHQFNALVSNGNFGTISLLSNVFSLEYREPNLGKDDVEAIKDQIKTLGTFINEAEIDDELKILLMGHLAYMEWAIQNVDLLGIESVYAAFAPAVLTARHAALSEHDAAEGHTAPKQKIYEQIKAIGQRVVELIDIAVKAVKGADQLKGGIQDLLPPTD